MSRCSFDQETGGTRSGYPCRRTGFVRECGNRHQSVGTLPLVLRI